MNRVLLAIPRAPSTSVAISDFQVQQGHREINTVQSFRRAFLVENNPKEEEEEERGLLLAEDRRQAFEQIEFIST